MRLAFNSAILFCFILTSLLSSPALSNPVMADSNTDGVKKAVPTADVAPADKKKDADKNKKDTDKKKKDADKNKKDADKKADKKKDAGKKKKATKKKTPPR